MQIYTLDPTVRDYVLWALASLGVFYSLAPLSRALRRNFAFGIRGLRRNKASAFPLRPVGDSFEQLRHVMAASFHKKKVMNKSEYRVFKAIEEELLARQDGHRVLSQISLGEIVGSPSRLAFLSINSKRVDILVMDAAGDPVAAVEFQGSGHYQGDAAARDAVKREALRRAGIHLVEVLESHTPAEIRQLVARVL